MRLLGRGGKFHQACRTGPAASKAAARPALAWLVPEPLLDVFAREARLVVSRLREFSVARYAVAAPPFASKAAAAHHLAERLALAAQGIEERTATTPPQWRQLPRLADPVLADQVAVTGHDLALAAAAAEAADPAWVPDRARMPVAAVVAGALAEVLLHRYDLDGLLPGPRGAAAALAELAPGTPPSPQRLLVVARARCPAYPPV